MSEEIDSRVTPSLHPGNVLGMEGYSDDVANILAPVERAFTLAYDGIVAIHDAREAAKRNPTWNEAQQVVETADFADKQVDRITRAFDSAHAGLQQVVNGLEAELSAPIEANTHGILSGEIRAHVKGLESAERLLFIRKLIMAGDKRSVEAVLGGPAFLSGLEPEMLTALTRMHHEQNNPAKANRLKTLKTALELVEKRGPLVFSERDKAVGENPHKIAKWRIQRAAASKAFTLPQS